ncbi:MAG: O-acetyl-ADP-ribose deacetylase [Desulfovibrio sp.]
MSMRIILCAFDGALAVAWDKALAGMRALPESADAVLERISGDITTLTVTAVVSPANSHGYMRGGVDLAYTRRFGEQLEASLRRKIAALPGGLLPVGEALVVETNDAAIPYLISAPTMERPMRLENAEPVCAATKAAMLAALDGGFESVAFPGMGTGTGGLDMYEAASAMVAGIEEAIRMRHE